MQLKTPSVVTLCPQISEAPSFLHTETRICPKVQPLMVNEILENDTQTYYLRNFSAIYSFRILENTEKEH